MSRVACAWADLVEDADAETWYEETHVSDAASKIASIARNCEQVEDNMFKEVPGIEGRYMTLYDLPDDATNINAQILPDPARLPKDTKIETRIYDEYATWYGEEWANSKLIPTQATSNVC